MLLQVIIKITIKNKIVLDLLNNESRYKKMVQLHNPYRKGKACKLIVNFIK